MSAKPTLNKTVLLLMVPLILFTIFGIFLYSRLGVDPRVTPIASVNKSLPNFTLPDLITGQSLNTSTLPKQPYLLNVWGSWCPACIKEHPQLQKIAATGIPVVGVNYKDEPNDALAYLTKNGNPYQHVIQDYTGQLGVDLGVTGAPENFIVDGNGVIKGHYVGEINEQIWQKVLAPCFKLIKQNPTHNCSIEG